MVGVAYAGSVPARKPWSGERQDPTVLIVEDEWLIRELVVEILGTEGYRVLQAADADEAISLLGREPIDLVFTDIDLGPGQDGVFVARKARAIRPDLKVVYASGRRQHLEPELKVAGAVFMAKPYRPMEICNVIGRMLDGQARS